MKLEESHYQILKTHPKATSSQDSGDEINT